MDKRGQGSFETFFKKYLPWIILFGILVFVVGKLLRDLLTGNPA